MTEHEFISQTFIGEKASCRHWIKILIKLENMEEECPILQKSIYEWERWMGMINIRLVIAITSEKLRDRCSVLQWVQCIWLLISCFGFFVCQVFRKSGKTKFVFLYLSIYPYAHSLSICSLLWVCTCVCMCVHTLIHSVVQLLGPHEL